MKKRIEWIDLVRAVGMFMIVMGHTLETYTFSWLGKLIFAVHVPVFFVLSGYLFREKTFTQTIRGGIRNLLLPYIATVIILVVGTRFHLLFPKLISEIDLHNLVVGALYGSGTTIPFFLDNSITIMAIGAIWFLLAMFWGNLIFTAVLKYSKQNLYVCTISVSLLAVFGFYLKYCGILLPRSLNAALVSQVFYGVFRPIVVSFT